MIINNYMFALNNNEPILILSINKAKKTLEIQEMNTSAETIIGLRSEDIAGKNVGEIFNYEIDEDFGNMIDRDDINSVVNYLNKKEYIELNNPINNKHKFAPSCRQLLSTSGENKFQLRLHDWDSSAKIKEFRGKLLLGAEASLENKEAMFPRQTMIKILQGLKNKNNFSMQICFALMKLDNYDKLCRDHNRAFVQKVIDETASRIQANIRDVDILGKWDTSEFAIITFCGVEGAEKLLTRIKQKVKPLPIGIVGGNKFITSLSIGLAPINGYMPQEIDYLIEQCEELATKAQKSGGNQIKLLEYSSN